MPTRIDIQIDVSGAVSLRGSCYTAAWIYLPDSFDQPRRPSVLFAFPGGSYSRSYFDLHVPGHEGYSFADHLVQAGYIIVVCDHIGIGDSTPYEPFSALTKDIVISADRSTVEGVLARLASGTVAAGFPPIIDPFTVGIGHSMGGYLLTILQARHHAFDAIALLGWTQLMEEAPSSEDEETTAALLSQLPDPTWLPREPARWFFHDEHVPDDVIAADDALAVRVYSWVFNGGKLTLLNDPEVTEAARQIDVPIFLGFGSRDVSPDPRREGSSYPASMDITTFVLPHSAHCTNFAETRQLLFDRLAAWGHSMYNLYRDPTPVVVAAPTEGTYLGNAR